MEWGDIYIGDDKKIFFGSDQNATIEYDEDGTDELRFAGAAATFEQAVTLDTTLGVTGAATFNSNLTISGDIILDDGGSLKEAGGTAALTFDGSGHITKIGQDSPSTGEFLKWEDGKAVWDSAGGGGGGSTTINNNADNRIITGSDSADTLEGEANLTFDGTDLTLQSSTTNKPVFEILNSTDDTTCGELKFNNNRGVGNGTNSDKCGQISFHGNDASGNDQQYAEIVALINDSVHNSEGGKLKLSVASHDGSLTNGILIIDGNASGEVDVEIGAGASSVTTIAGSLKLSSMGTDICTLENISSDFVISSNVQDKDILFKGNDGGVEITALTLDMSEGGLMYSSKIDKTDSAIGDGFDDCSLCNIFINKFGGEIITTFQIDITGLFGAALGGSVIGSGSNPSNFYQVTSSSNGILYKVELNCIQTPSDSTGMTQSTSIGIKYHSSAMNHGNDYDGNLLINASSQSIGQQISTSTTLINGLNNQYLHLYAGTMGSPDYNAYNAGKFLVKLYGATF